MVHNEYAEVLAWLYGLEAARGMDFKLERVELALRHLGDPHRRYPVLHVAGTNGKGSVAAMLDAVYGAAGYRVGLYTSPHLVSFGERIRVGGSTIPPETVVALTREIQSAVLARGIELTFFELVTVMGLLHFARAEVDLAVIEVGLGGRLDATNVVLPEVAIVTNIGRDHEEYLGEALAAIAREKAGIVKAGRPAIVGPMTEEAAGAIAERAAQVQAPTYWYGRDFSVSDDVPFRFDGLGARIEGLTVGLRGSYQRTNAALALAAIVWAQPRFPVSEVAVRRGLAEVRWPGRLEVVQTQPLVVLDGAHNTDGLAALVAEVPRVTGGRRVHVLFAVMRDKRWEDMVAVLGPIAASATVTRVLPPRGADPEPVARAFRAFCPARAVDSPESALECVCAQAGSDDAVLVCGSLFLIGAVYPYFLDRRGVRSLFDPSDAVRVS
ncbi:bifunctional folylpolyglutamate synthase/dihydrofolate synthase [Candidatus Binatia bacterium]|nr:bifunctional folylpolyglutamate synthase/dihydrofolate synthase [Candidatus Binatia bacterium]